MVKKQEYPGGTKKHLALIAPLDWGLGHTTRCIPIIRELQKNNFQIVIACNSNQKAILEEEFPDAIFTHLQGYGLKYAHSRYSTRLKLILQLPKILISIKRENLQFKRILHQFTPKIIISDNRYGVFSSSIRSVFITHQLKIITGVGVLADKLTQFATHRLIKRFDECWVPDFAGTANLAGELSHPTAPPDFPVRYIGALSRLEKCSDPDEDDFNVIPGSETIDIENSDHLLVILSGPEPQRTVLESILLKQLEVYTGKAIIVRGLPLETLIPSTSSNLTMINYAGSVDLNRLICKAKVVICRSGYTSVMDLLKLGKKAVLIPTPGQAEQEYLARYLGEKNLAIIAYQDRLQILESVRLTKTLGPATFESMDEYKKAISELADKANVR